MSDDFKAYLNNNQNLLDVIQTKSCFQMIKSNMHVMNGTQVSNQGGFISAFSSVLQIADTRFSDMSLDASALTIIGTNATIESSSATDITLSGTNSYSFIITSLDSVLNINDFSFTNNTTPMLTALTTNVKIDLLTLANVFVFNRVLFLDDW